MQDPTKNIAIIYNPRLIPNYVSNNFFGFSYVDPETEKLYSKSTKSKPMGMTPLKSVLLTVGVNWVSEEELELGIKKSVNYPDWEAMGVLRVISRRKLTGVEDSYTGTIADYKREEGNQEFADIRLIIKHTYDRAYLVNLKNQAPALFQGNNVMIAQKICDDQLKIVDTQLSGSVNNARFHQAVA